MRAFLFLIAFCLTFGLVPAGQRAEPTNVAWANGAREAGFRRFVERRLNLISRPMRGPFEYEEPAGWFAEHSFRHRFLSRTFHTYDGDRSARDRQRPAIVLLHGSGRTGISMIDMWRRVADEHGLILIAPDSAMRSGWSPLADSAAFLARVIDQAEQTYPIDRDRLFLFGHSAGAIHATTLSKDNALGVRAVGAHAGFPGRVGRAAAERRIPIAFFLGEHDHLFSSDDARRVGQSLSANGHHVTLSILPNHSHWYYADGPMINDEAWRFFSRQRAPMLH